METTQAPNIQCRYLEQYREIHPRLQTKFRNLLLQEDTPTKLLIAAELFDDAKELNLPKPYTYAECNQILNANYRQGDFNALPDNFVKNKASLKKAARAAEKAKQKPYTIPWHKHWCQTEGCKNEVLLTKAEYDWFEEHGYELPTYCPECMKKLSKGDRTDNENT